MKKWLLIALFVLYWLHNDLWFWNDTRLISGIPIGMLYHILYCIAASILMFLLTKYAWPQDLEVEEKSEPGP
jgi:hypothetical protein